MFPLNSTAASQCSCSCCLGAVVMVMLTWFLLTWENQVWNQIFKILDGKQIGEALLPFFRKKPNFLPEFTVFFISLSLYSFLASFILNVLCCLWCIKMYYQVPCGHMHSQEHSTNQIRSLKAHSEVVKNIHSCSIWCVKMNASWCVQDSSEGPPPDLSIIHGTKTRFFWLNSTCNNTDFTSEVNLTVVNNNKNYVHSI